MAKLRLKMLPLNLLALISLMTWGASASVGESVPSPSPPADVELICHTDNPAECYPKIFQPTREFQVVRPDQDLPLGLHVRLDVTTGLKEAKINVPDEIDPALAGLPVDSSMVVIEQDQQAEPAKPVVPPNAPAYDAAGKIKTPKPADNPGEGSAFYKSLTILKKGLDVDDALEMLEDISHDIYYGLKIAEDLDTIRELFCLSTAPLPAAADAATTTLHRARLASLTLASTFQNNPKALASLEQHWPALGPSICGQKTPNNNKTPLSTAIFTLPTTTTDNSPDPTASLTKARTNLLSALLKSPTFRAPFLASRAPSDLLRILTLTTDSTSSSWDAAQRAAALLLVDNFLDADMGATLGEWPVPGRAQRSDRECAALFGVSGQGQGGSGGDGSGEGGKEVDEEECLFWLVRGVEEKFRKAGEEHWSRVLGEKLRLVKGKGGKGRGREKVEL